MSSKKDNKQINIQLFDNKRASSYEDRKLEYNFNTVPFEWHLANSLKFISNNSKVIDIGCGTGELIRNIAKNKTGKFIGVDLSESMIDIAKSNTPNIQNIQFDAMSSLDLKIENNEFDFALMRGALHHFSNPQKAIGEAFRILKKNGQLHILDILSYEDSEIDIFFNKTNVLRQPANFQFYPKSKLVEFCKNAGFNQIELFEHIITMDLDKWLNTYNETEKVRNLFLNSSEKIKKAFNLREENRIFLIDFVSFYLVAKK